ncbi:VOC family protein [Citricoccus sp.]|uniref:VOC family protein n=1 Tax=Citricoccus sp. TaxID=1978372 RepID=UPI0028BD6194|nr:VOC family protein [Citricoccus sp.]
MNQTSTGIGSNIYVNLPIQDVAAARTFWTAVGVRISEDYSDENALSLSFSPHVTVMLLTRDFYASFLNGKPVADTQAANGAIVALDAAARENVDPFVDAALAAGATEVPPSDPNPAQEMVDAGLMYGRTFTDPDGHQWEVLWMSSEMPAG